jgi:3-deoxy-7-phosphoheptulonate synthase
MNIETLGEIHEIDHNWTVIAGPCAAESEEQIVQSSRMVAKSGAQVLRAGLWKPRTDPDSWQGAGEKALEWMKEAKRQTGIAITTEANSTSTIEATLKAEFDILWVGSRNSTYFPLLDEIGKQTSEKQVPVILKRGMGSELDEWLGAADYIRRHNPNVILCERGIKGFNKCTRNTLDLQTAKLAQIESGLPVIIDVSHAAGRRDLILPMALAVKAAGFNGLMIETHPKPDLAMTDSKQQISLENFENLMDKLKTIPNQI